MVEWGLQDPVIKTWGQDDPVIGLAEPPSVYPAVAPTTPLTPQPATKPLPLTTKLAEPAKAFVRGIEHLIGTAGSLAKWAVESPFVKTAEPGAALIDIATRWGPDWMQTFAQKMQRDEKETIKMADRWADWWEEQAFKGWEAPTPEIMQAKWSEMPITKGVATIAEAAPNYLAAIAASILTKSPQTGLMFISAVSGASAYRKQRKAGTGRAMANAIALLTGAWEYVTEKVPFEAVFKPSKSVLKKMLKISSLEAAQEFVQGIGENFLEYFGYNAKDLDSVPLAIREGVSHALDGWVENVVGGAGLGIIGGGIVRTPPAAKPLGIVPAPEVAPAAPPVAEVPAEGIKLPPKPIQAKPEAKEAREAAPMAKERVEVKPTRLVKPKLYIGNVTPRAKKVFAEIWGKRPSEIKVFTEKGFPTKREAIEVSHKEAQKAHDILVKSLLDDFENNRIRTDPDVALAMAHWGDIKQLRETLGLKIGEMPFKVIRAPKHEMRVIKNTKSRIWAAVKPSTLYESGMTVQQVLDATMKKAEVVSAKAYLEGARETVAIHKDLARYAHEKLKGLDINQTERTRLLSFIAVNRTTAQKIHAIAAIEMLAERAGQRIAIKELQAVSKKIKPRIGKTMQEKGIRPEYAKKLNTLVDSFATKKLSQWRIKDIGNLKNYLFNLKEGISNDPSIDEVYRAKLAEMLIPEKRLTQLDKLSQSSIHLLKAEDIRTITTELKRLVHLNDVKNKLYLGRTARKVSEYLKRSVKEQESVKDESRLPKEETLTTSRQPRGILRATGRFVAGVDNHDTKTLAFTIEGGKEGVVAEIFGEGFRYGRRVENDHKVKILKYTRKFLADNNIDHSDLVKLSPAFATAFRGRKGQKVRRLAGKQVPIHKVKIAGKEIGLTMADMMSVYMHAQSDFNLKAMLKEGVASIIEEKGTLTPEELAVITNHVESNPKALALTKMYAHIAENINRPAINKVSMDLKGIEIADVENYFTVERFTRGKVAGNQEYQINLLELQSFLLERIGSKNPIVIRDFFAVLMANMDGVSEYVGMAKPFRAAHTLLSYKNWAKAVDGKGHEIQRRHLNTLMEHTEQKPKVRGRMEAIFGRVLRGATRSVLAEPGIMAGQIMSEINYHATDIPSKYLLMTNPVPSGAEVERACDEFPWMWVRRNLGAASIVTRDISRTDAALRAFTGKKALINLPPQGINYVDMKAITYGRKAVAKWVAATTNLKGQEFVDEVNKRTHKAVSESQPMFETENRSILTSNPNVLAKVFFLFRSYIDQTLRIMSRARTAHRNGVISRPAMASKFGIIFAGFAAYKMLRILVNALLYRRKEDPYEIARDILLSPMRALTVVGYPAERQISRMLDIVGGRKPKTRYFDVGFENLVTSTINEAWDATKDYGDAAAYLGTGEIYESGPNKGKLKSDVLLLRATEKMAYAMGKIAGLPTPSLRRFRYGWTKEPEKATIKPRRRAGRRKRRRVTF